MVTITTETGERIELTTEQVNDGAKAEAFVAEQRAKLGLPSKPMSEKDVPAFVAERAKLAKIPTTQQADSIAASVQAIRERAEADAAKDAVGPLDED